MGTLPVAKNLRMWKNCREPGLVNGKLLGECCTYTADSDWPPGLWTPACGVTLRRLLNLSGLVFSSVNGVWHSGSRHFYHIWNTRRGVELPVTEGLGAEAPSGGGSPLLTKSNNHCMLKRGCHGLRSLHLLFATLALNLQVQCDLIMSPAIISFNAQNSAL